MAGPAPELVFEIFGLEAWEFVIGNEDRTKLLFAMRDSRSFVVWYFYSERLSLSASGPFDAAALLVRKYDKQRATRNARAFRVRIQAEGSHSR